MERSCRLTSILKHSPGEYTVSWSRKIQLMSHRTFTSFNQHLETFLRMLSSRLSHSTKVSDSSTFKTTSNTTLQTTSVVTKRKQSSRKGWTVQVVVQSTQKVPSSEGHEISRGHRRGTKGCPRRYRSLLTKASGKRQIRYGVSTFMVQRGVSDL